MQAHTHSRASRTPTREEGKYLEEPRHCSSQSEALIRICSQDLLLSAHKHTRARGGKRWGGEKAEGHVGGERGSRQHLQSPLLIALLPAWSQITGLELLQSGLYLLANLSPPQIRTSKPSSYHLLVHLQRRKRRRGTVKSDSFAAPGRLWEVGTPTPLFPGLEGFRAVFPLRLSFDPGALASERLP